MQYRELGRTGWKVSELSFGSWAIGGTWGPVDESESLAALHRAVDLGSISLTPRMCMEMAAVSGCWQNYGANAANLSILQQKLAAG